MTLRHRVSLKQLSFLIHACYKERHAGKIGVGSDSRARRGSRDGNDSGLGEEFERRSLEVLFFLMLSSHMPITCFALQVHLSRDRTTTIKQLFNHCMLDNVGENGAPLSTPFESSSRILAMLCSALPLLSAASGPLSLSFTL